MRMWLVALAALSWLFGGHCGALARPASPPRAIQFDKCPSTVAAMQQDIRCGIATVYEDRTAGHGRQLPLKVLVVPARSGASRLPPIFFVAGGPGQTATDFAGYFARSWHRQDRDVVLMDQRGTGDGHRLDCFGSSAEESPQTYLAPIFEPGRFARCLVSLARKADLSRYSTADHADDLDDVRRRLGYRRIALIGGSYGTRAILEYVRRHRGHAAVAIMTSPVPPEYRIPLYHAQSAQFALDGLIARCRSELACAAAFPDPAGDLAALLERLRARAAEVVITDPASGARVPLRLDAATFGEALRVMLYSDREAARVPLLLHRARLGDLGPFALTALTQNRALRSSLRFGLQQAVVCSEDMPFIKAAEVPRVTANTFLGDARLVAQRSACAGWPAARRSPSDVRVRSPIPVLLISGDLDPVTPPQWGRIMARHFTRAKHVIVRGGHSPFNDCTEELSRAVLVAESVDRLDTSCAMTMKPRPFVLSEA